MASKSREELSQFLKDRTGIRNLYFQPPSTVKMSYPCIRYSLSEIQQRHADNNVYSTKKRYQLMLISKDPDNPHVDLIAALPTCRFNRSYTADNLYHYVFEIYY